MSRVPCEAAQNLDTAAASHQLSKEDLRAKDAVGRRRSMEAWAGKYKMGAWRSLCLKEPVQGLVH